MNSHDLAPLPPPNDDVCPRCGAPVDSVGLEKGFCAFCGERVWKPQQIRRKTGCLKTCGLLFLLFVSILSGAIGACTLKIAETMRTSSRRNELFSASDLKTYWSVGIGALIIAFALFVLVIWLNRKSK